MNAYIVNMRSVSPIAFSSAAKIWNYVRKTFPDHIVADGNGTKVTDLDPKVFIRCARTSGRIWIDHPTDGSKIELMKIAVY